MQLMITPCCHAINTTCAADLFLAAVHITCSTVVPPAAGEGGSQVHVSQANCWAVWWHSLPGIAAAALAGMHAWSCVKPYTAHSEAAVLTMA